MIFWWPSKYHADYELRNWDALVQTVQTMPHGVFWPLLGARRSGKTWALNAIEAAIGPANAAHVTLDQIDAKKQELPEHARGRTVLLFDEPGSVLFHDTAPEQVMNKGWELNVEGAKQFVEWCQRLKHTGTIVTLALTPAEWHALREVGGALVSSKDLEYRRLGPLSAAQSQRFPRTPTQHQLFEQLPPTWRRNPFLLAEFFRHVLDTPEGNLRNPLSRDDIHKFGKEVIGELNSGKYDYLYHVLYDCLIPEHRGALRMVAEHERPSEDLCRMLLHLGLLMQSDSGEYEIGDPVLADHYPPPVRIHHISDLHFGPKTALSVDAKDNSVQGRKLAKAAGQGPIRDDYLDWLAQLETHQRPHLVVVSGDIAEAGQDDQLEAGRAWLDRVAACLAPHPGLDPDDPRLLLVPGNHDVDWTAVDGPAGGRRPHLAFARVFTGTSWPFPQLVEPPETREPAHQHYRSLGLAFALLGSPEYGGANHEHYGRLDPGLVHDRDIQHLRSAVWKHEPIRIAVVHHPLAQVPSIATEITSYSGLTNGGQLQAALEEQGFTLLLHGHTHAAYLERKGELLIAGAGTLGSRETYERHGFNEIIVTREGQRYKVQAQTYERKGGSFAPRAVEQLERVAT
ncbi:metallophosphoesterase [Enhygromyxa salina]|uniref:3',5'-cyclic adenosine monophosphate phosphodiesterase CpdA n=1 Tax=Enhygromyxa salina TaxID=215803 RepID=A0A2S9YUJ7_9BACT|nr:metallophosphoesterase [Enhygromyxa salina]PRQ08763.1 3',5'-cyclic adenosine monophosphate phosphodiesterase CpdA [Enhygromyxa salina]